jgi:Rap1a immunity proteins
MGARAVKKINFGRYLFCFLLVLFSSSAWPQSDQPINTTGNVFYAQCAPQSAMYANCAFYVNGFMDGLGFLNALLESNGKQKLFCVPSGGNSIISPVSAVQLIDVVMRYLQRNPQRRHEYTVALVIDAFKEAFPCR